MNESRHAEQAALVALLRSRPEKMSWHEIASSVLERGSALGVWHDLVPAALLSVPGLPDPLATASEDLKRWAAGGCVIVTILDEDYPARLRGIHQAPPILFARGELKADDCAVSVVGSRRASPSGLEVADAVARGLVARGISVAAGLALGIDTAAHRAALAAGGRTVALIGTGINKVYPAENRQLHEEIALRGLLISQFWPDAPPNRRSFLMRNATMSGYGIATVVVEAGETSGTRAQARMAVEHGRPVILMEAVVEHNEWAQALVGRPGVHIAQSVPSVLARVDQLIKEQDTVGSDLRRFVPA
ncbi:MAG: DNA-processing protein DprA [Actinomycetota bacterium]|nr:DNA-processing protein DprA [Actinomycetota bacterium]